MGGINNQYINASGNQCGNTLVCTLTYANRGAYTQSTLIVLTGMGMLFSFVDIGNGNQTFKLKVIIDNQHFLNSVLMQ